MPIRNNKTKMFSRQEVNALQNYAIHCPVIRLQYIVACIDKA